MVRRMGGGMGGEGDIVWVSYEGSLQGGLFDGRQNP